MSQNCGPLQAQHFNGKQQNGGILTGLASGGLVDVDLDCAEALALADGYLPWTKAVFSRPSKQRSHRLYDIVDGLRQALVQTDLATVAEP